MGRKDIKETNDKMALVAAVAAKWPNIGRNAILGFKMESMREALLTGNPAALEAPEKGALPCAIKSCEGERLKGFAVCREHRAAYVKGRK
jgi:hypothetical protein